MLFFRKKTPIKVVKRPLKGPKNILDDCSHGIIPLEDNDCANNTLNTVIFSKEIE